MSDRRVEHLCSKTKTWRDGPAKECECQKGKHSSRRQGGWRA